MRSLEADASTADRVVCVYEENGEVYSKPRFLVEGRPGPPILQTFRTFCFSPRKVEKDGTREVGFLEDGQGGRKLRRTSFLHLHVIPTSPSWWPPSRRFARGECGARLEPWIPKSTTTRQRFNCRSLPECPAMANNQVESLKL